VKLNAGWLDVDGQVVAHQMCLFEFRLFSAISPKEILNQNWQKHKEKSPNVLAYIDQFNKTARWVQYAIVKPYKLKERVECLIKFIELGHMLFELNNYNGLNEILCGVNSSPVRRLKKTWEVIE